MAVTSVATVSSYKKHLHALSFHRPSLYDPISSDYIKFTHSEIQHLQLCQYSHAFQEQRVLVGRVGVHG